LIIKKVATGAGEEIAPARPEEADDGLDVTPLSDVTPSEPDNN
jgi:hypothetical protein